jgi:Uncharacterized protein containing a ferredoxin domain
MALVFQQEIAENAVVAAAFQIANAARTAPKARGIDNLVIAVAYGEELEAIAQKMLSLFNEGKAPANFERDANNLRDSQALVLIGTRIKPIGLKACGLCGFGNCAHREEHHPDAPCMFNAHDLGLAVGSAASKAADMRIDNRVMYSVGGAVREMGLMGADVPIIMGLPLCVASKSPYYDRKQ